VRRNGLGPLRTASEENAELFYTSYRGRTDDYNTKFIALLVVGILLPFLAMVILIPVVTALFNTNNKVFSMFGDIPTDEINDLATKCEKFIMLYLEDRSERRDFSFDSKLMIFKIKN
jgi:hypothetical protein